MLFEKRMTPAASPARMSESSELRGSQPGVCVDDPLPGELRERQALACGPRVGWRLHGPNVWPALAHLMSGMRTLG